jgi:hypothetical protein
MEPKKKSLILGLLAPKGKPSSESGSEPDDDDAVGPEEDDAPTGDGAELGNTALDAVNHKDPQSLYDAICAIVDEHMSKDESSPSDSEDDHY